jgi:hypothetical protein
VEALEDGIALIGVALRDRIVRGNEVGVVNAGVAEVVAQRGDNHREALDRREHAREVRLRAEDHVCDLTH